MEHEVVREEMIEAVITRMENPEVFLNASREFIENQPSIIAYLNSEGFSLLSEEEMDLLWYCILVVSESIKKVKKVNLVDIEDIEETEEENYILLGGKDLKFEDIADRFFPNYIQEDLLAFAEDTLVPDDEDFISPAGRKIIFITLKTLIDVMVEN